MKSRIIILLLLAVLLSACSANSPQPAATALPAPASLTPQPGTGAITGTVAGVKDRWPDDEVILYAAPFQETQGGAGYYVLEPQQHPHVALAPDGSFGLNDIHPGKYVLMVGPEPAAARLVVDDSDQTRIITVTADTVQPLGTLTLTR